MPITTADQLVAAHATPLHVGALTKSSLTTVANRWQSMWTAGGTPGSGATPGAAAIPTKATTGALVNFPAITGGLKGYADCSGLSNSTAATQVLIYDRLAHMGGLSGTSTSGQTVNVGVPDRGDVTNYTGVMAFAEVYTALGATPQTLTFTYLNGTGSPAGNRTGTCSIPANAAAGNLFMMAFQAGDQSVRSVSSVQLGGSTGTAGNFGITLARQVAVINVPVVGAMHPSPISILGEIPENACLWAVVIPPSTASGIVQGAIRVIQG